MKTASLVGLVALFCMFAGCQQQDVGGAQAQADDASEPSTSKPAVAVAEVAAESEEADPTAPPEEPAADVETWAQITQLYEQAKSSGTTAAESATDWLSELYGQADEMRISATEGTLEWVEESYEQARRSGETSATNAKDWVLGDMRKIGAWEYKTLVLPADEPEKIESELNKLGADRWECFWVDKQGSTATFYMKKPGRSYLRNIPARELFRLLPLLPGGGDAAP